MVMGLKALNFYFFFLLHLRVLSPALTMVTPSLPQLGCPVVNYAESRGN